MIFCPAAREVADSLLESWNFPPTSTFALEVMGPTSADWAVAVLVIWPVAPVFTLAKIQT